MRGTWTDLRTAGHGAMPHGGVPVDLGESGIRELWWMIWGEEWCSRRVTRRRSREGTQFIAIWDENVHGGAQISPTVRRRGKQWCDDTAGYLLSREYDTSAWTPCSREAQWGRAWPPVIPRHEALKRVSRAGHIFYPSGSIRRAANRSKVIHSHQAQISQASANRGGRSLASGSKLIRNHCQFVFSVRPDWQPDL
jgi:hypothetical protein